MAELEYTKSPWVFPGDSPGAPILGTSLDHQHDGVRDNLKLSKNFVVHSLRHTTLTRLGEADDAFTIMRIAGHSSVTVSQRYVHPTPEGMERAFGRMQELNGLKFAQDGGGRQGRGGRGQRRAKGGQRSGQSGERSPGSIRASV